MHQKGTICLIIQRSSMKAIYLEQRMASLKKFKTCKAHDQSYIMKCMIYLFNWKEDSMNNGSVPWASSIAIEGTSTWSSSSLYTSTTCKRQSH